MKKLASVILLISLITLSGCAQTYSNKLAVYDFDTLIVQYELDGDIQGDETLYIRGDESAIYRYITRGEQEEQKLELHLGEKKQIVNMIALTAVEVTDQDYVNMEDLNKEGQENYLIRKDLGLREDVEIPKSTMTKKIAGQTCDVYEVSNVREVCIWKGIILENTTSIAGITNTKTATSIMVNKDIDTAKFQIPSNVVLAK